MGQSPDQCDFVERAWNHLPLGTVVLVRVCVVRAHTSENTCNAGESLLLPLGPSPLRDLRGLPFTSPVASSPSHLCPPAGPATVFLEVSSHPHPPAVSGSSWEPFLAAEAYAVLTRGLGPPLTCSSHQSLRLQAFLLGVCPLAEAPPLCPSVPSVHSFHPSRGLPEALSPALLS